MAQFTRIGMGMQTLFVLSVLLTILLLSGCGQDEKDKFGEITRVVPSVESEGSFQISIDDIRPDTVISYDCSTNTGTPDKRFWCMGLQAWNESQYHNQNETDRNEFIEAWKLGTFDAQQALDPTTEKLRDKAIALAGYESGYINVLDAIGVIEYECSDGVETDNEYRDRWCEAAAAFNASRLASPVNAILRSTYINGYMSGRAIALTLPTSMESLFGGEARADVGSKQAIDEPEAGAPKSIKVFSQGFNDGFKVMLDTVRESVNQVMEQMQNMEGMPGMEAFPGMEDMEDMEGMPPSILEPTDTNPMG